MLDNLKLSVKNSLIYSLGNVSLKITGLILIPIYTNPKYLTVEDYGTLGMLEIVAQLAAAVLELSLIQSLTRWFWDSNYSKRQKSMFFTVMVAVISLSLTFNIFIRPFTDSISTLLFSRPDISYLIRLMFLSAGLDVLVGCIQTLLKLQQKALKFTSTNIVKLLVNLAVTIVLITVYDYSVDAIFIGQICGSIIFVSMLLPHIIKNMEPRFDLPLLKEMLSYSYPLIIASVSAILLNTLDRYFLNYYSDIRNVGLYSLGFKIANTIKILVVTSIQMAMSPMLFKMMYAPDRFRFYSKYMTYFSYVTMIMILGLSLFSLEIIKVITVDRAYWESFKIIPIVCMAIFFGMLKDTSLLGLQIAKNSKAISGVIILITLMNVGLNFILTPVLGMYGASLSSLIAQIFFFIIIYRIAQRNYPIPYEIKKIVILFVSGSILLVFSYLPNAWSPVLRVSIKAVVFISFPFLLGVLRFYEKIERVRLKELFFKWRNPFHWPENFEQYFKT
ncbi:MAG: oligosaccharide flippase family protein [Bacteroidales bacterium]|nr:oligosaccharide flippase family protein [Bacteroidales bacterium]